MTGEIEPDTDIPANAFSWLSQTGSVDMAGSGQAFADIDPITVWIGEHEGALAVIPVGQSLDDPDAAEDAEIAATRILR